MTIGRLRAIRDLAAAQGGAEAAWFVGGIDAYLAGDAESLDSALELLPQAGRDARFLDAIERRDATYREAAERFGLDAAALARELAEYYTRHWDLHDRGEPECPQHRSALQKLLFAALKIHDRMLHERQLRRILRGHGDPVAMSATNDQTIPVGDRCHGS